MQGRRGKGEMAPESDCRIGTQGKIGRSLRHAGTYMQAQADIDKGRMQTQANTGRFRPKMHASTGEYMKLCNKVGRVKIRFRVFYINYYTEFLIF